ncbi:GGDEF domain-containing protein [Pseudoxanthomonas broegbernensis]|uniref:diguanylate cyclase n=1 Tax=Pseudoxanthomonas broegbernensis TaxID=83619 RepID=A0A7V8GP42_9GAMM|nr:GGDEF domain-containing protein [Pseudoxanthomonas broegbernensis]KAF1687366.1 GGDEF domain-containing protein [Pseudoxanthomonas broegbernensis]MBB6065631.1 diguanylate cyclase (GGDEF)-like protein [Pseudoxanthomonas broegbernensis]
MVIRSKAPASAHAPAAAAVPAALEAAAHDPRALLPAFAEDMAALPGELGDLGRRLQSACQGEDWATCARVLRQFLDKYLRGFAQSLDAPSGAAAESEQLRELLRQAVGVALASLLQPLPALADESSALGSELKQWQPGKELAPLARRVRELCHQVGVHAGDATEQQALMLSLFDLLLENLAELLEDGSWLQGQVAVVRELLAGDPDRQTLEATRQGLREMVYQQGLLKQGIVDSKDAMRGMMVTFVERLDGMSASAGQFQSRLENHMQAVRQARSITELGKRLDEVLEDTVRLQEQAQRARAQMATAREEVDAAEARVRELEAQLRDVSELIATDPLTGALNRRGFEELYEREVARAEREARPLALAVLDLDAFRKLNADHGHAGGDAALRHVVEVIREGLRASDAVFRYGGEEFVLLLPGSGLDEATATVHRLQRELAARPLRHEGRRICVAFSAGVAVRQLGEERDHLVRRADRAMYEAKHAGRNRVVAAH